MKESASSSQSHKPHIGQGRCELPAGLRGLQPLDGEGFDDDGEGFDDDGEGFDDQKISDLRKDFMKPTVHALLDQP